MARDVDWLEGARRFPGELRLPDVACVVRVASRTELKDCCRSETRYYISSAPLTATRAAHGVRGHWRIESAPQAQERKVRDELTDRAQAA